MNTPPAMRILYADTQSLIYAYEKDDPLWQELFNQHFATGYRLALTEENILEFSQSPTLDAGRTLTRRILKLNPLWIRSFVDIQADEVRGFVEQHSRGVTAPKPEVFRSSFEAVSQAGERLQFDALKFVELFSSDAAQSQLQDMRQEHADLLNTLSRATASGELTNGHIELALRNAFSARLRRGSDNTTPFAEDRVEEAVKFCIKHRKWLLRECQSFAVEHHLANYRSSNAKRNARLSDSVDLTAMVAALPYVDSVITNDGYLYAGLEYVKRKIPAINTQLIRRPEPSFNEAKK